MSFNYPSEYNYVLRDVRKDLDERRQRARDILATADHQEREVAEALSRVTTGFLTTGLWELPADLPYVPFKWASRSPFDWVTYAKRVSLDWHRPAVIVQECGSSYYNANSSRIVHISKKQYTAPLYSWFLLLPANRIYGCSRYWRFVLYNEHEDLYQKWREQCSANPDYRKALRLPDYPTPVKESDDEKA